MNREHKYRAFYKPTKTMYWFDIMNGNHGQGNGYIGMAPFGEDICLPNGNHRSNMLMVDPTDCEIMQFIGLTDIKGNDVIEGDILQIDNELKLVIEYKGGQFVGVNSRYNVEIQNRNWLQWEIIGNIYENPELLK